MFIIPDLVVCESTELEVNVMMTTCFYYDHEHVRFSGRLVGEKEIGCMGN